ncbi:MAG TPA: acetyl-CoA C-acetyltransferase [Acidimicrobiales bacterium]|nr:acetyl-CoA C-acetyltransferase [Acidimicrobiales bacterium]
MPEAVVVAAGRTPIGRAAKGSLVDCRPDDLLASVMRGVLGRVPALDPGTIEDIVVGCAQPAGESGFNIARVAGLLLGRSDLPGTTVSRYCASSLQALRIAAHAVRAGEGDVFLVGGIETVSRYVNGKADDGPRNPRFEGAVERSERRASGGADRWEPATGLPDVYIAMGQTAENVAEIEHVSRAEMDEFALLSQTRAVTAQKDGFFDREIVPVTTPAGLEVGSDDGPRPGTSLEALGKLEPVFRPGGTVTAGNCCPLNDGAAALVVTSDRRAAELGIAPLARVVASGVSALDPEIMGLGPIEASRQALRRAGMTMGDVDLVEINEAFAAQAIPCARHLGVDWDRLNVRGGAIALGHPFGMTGARIATTLLNALQDCGGTIGLETMCTAGGQGMAMIFERSS